jgi:hypothetical protein
MLKTLNVVRHRSRIKSIRAHGACAGRSMEISFSLKELHANKAIIVQANQLIYPRMSTR